ncbi:hypothetical protein H4R19_004255 [Coemansia spiralis]|nr:hypothetical protein H4R19_004255 [Coemansia spiralis]
MGLAETKNRTMYAADPRNLQWSQDKGRFGFRMLEKMGWSEGKGLGANEDGQKEHVKIKLKTNAHGVGADKKTIRNWLAHSSGFDALLGRLNSETDAAPGPQPATPEEPEELAAAAEVAKPSGAIGQRLSHRARFRRMKQMALQDERGLQEILGISAKKAPKSDSDALQETKTTSSALSTADYFASKMADNPALAALYGVPSPAPSPAEDSDSAVPLEPPRAKRRTRDDDSGEAKAKKSKHDKTKKSKSSKDKKSKDKTVKDKKSKDKKSKKD